mgnify:CR=1 FL=1
MVPNKNWLNIFKRLNSMILVKLLELCWCRRNGLLASSLQEGFARIFKSVDFFEKRLSNVDSVVK